MNRSTLEEIRERVHHGNETHLDTTWLLTELDRALGKLSCIADGELETLERCKEWARIAFTERAP